MKVILLAAGRSNRMAPVDDKNCVKFFGIPLVRHQVNQLMKNGYKDILVLVGAHNLENIQKEFKLDKNIQIVQQKNLDLGMAGAILDCDEFIDQGEEVLIVSGNDVVEDKAFIAINDAIKNVKSDVFILAKKVFRYFPGGYLKTDDNGFIYEIIEKPKEGYEPSDLVNLVFHYFKDGKQMINFVSNAKSDTDDLYEIALFNMMNDKIKFFAIPYDGSWQPVKFPWHILDLMKMFLDNLSEDSCNKSLVDNKPQIADSAVIKGNVFFEKGVKVLDHASIVGPAYIGKNVVVASNALVRDSHIGNDSVVGYSTEIARSYLSSNVWTHSNYIGDSVICDNCSFGAGCVTGNLRLDEGEIFVEVKGYKVNTNRNKFGLTMGANVRAGINNSFMPGVKIGSNSMIGAGVIVSGDIDNNKFVYLKDGKIIIKNNIKDVPLPEERNDMKKNI